MTEEKNADVAAEEEGWEEVASDMGKTIRWEEEAKSDKEREKTVYIGPIVHGVYRGKRENIGENDATMYQIEAVGDGMLSIWGTTVLDDLMKRVYEGNEVKITYKGKQKPKSGGKAYAVFGIQQRPAPSELLERLAAQKGESSGSLEEEVEDVEFE